MMVDKYKVRDYIAEKLGEEYLIPLLGVWDNADDIDFDKLPEQFVLKCNHNSGLGMCICKDKSKLDIEKVKKELNQGLKQDYYLTGREWPYKNVSRKIICEQYMVDESGYELKDYKIFCFDGNVDSIMVCEGRTEDNVKYYFYGKNWDRLFYQHDEIEPIGYIEKPTSLDKMTDLAEQLSFGLNSVRVDFYDINGNINFCR